jgi:hypothetical protein
MKSLVTAFSIQSAILMSLSPPASATSYGRVDMANPNFAPQLLVELRGPEGQTGGYRCRKVCITRGPARRPPGQPPCIEWKTECGFPSPARPPR